LGRSKLATLKQERQKEITKFFQTKLCPKNALLIQINQNSTRKTHGVRFETQQPNDANNMDHTLTKTHKFSLQQTQDEGESLSRQPHHSISQYLDMVAWQRPSRSILVSSFSTRFRATILY